MYVHEIERCIKKSTIFSSSSFIIQCPSSSCCICYSNGSVSCTKKLNKLNIGKRNGNIDVGVYNQQERLQTVSNTLSKANAKQTL